MVRVWPDECVELPIELFGRRVVDVRQRLIEIEPASITLLQMTPTGVDVNTVSIMEPA